MTGADSIELQGCTIRQLLVSAPLHGEAIEGLGRPQYCSFVVELTDGRRFLLGPDSLTQWSGSEPLSPVSIALLHGDSMLDCRNQTILEVLRDEDGDLALVLANQTQIQVSVDWGTRLLVTHR